MYSPVSHGLMKLGSWDRALCSPVEGKEGLTCCVSYGRRPPRLPTSSEPRTGSGFAVGKIPLKEVHVVDSGTGQV